MNGTAIPRPPHEQVPPPRPPLPVNVPPEPNPPAEKPKSKASGD